MRADVLESSSGLESNSWVGHTMNGAFCSGHLTFAKTFQMFRGASLCCQVLSVGCMRTHTQCALRRLRNCTNAMVDDVMKDRKGGNSTSD